MNVDDKQIIEGCIRKESKYQRMLYEKYSDILFGICRKNAKSKEDAEDIFQDAFIKLYRSLEKYSFLGSFEGWLKKFFMREAWNYYRGQKNKVSKVDIEENTTPKIENTALDTFTNQELLHCLERLPDKERIVFVMSEIEGLSWEEISNNIELEIPTVKSMCSRAKKKLIEMFRNV